MNDKEIDDAEKEFQDDVRLVANKVGGSYCEMLIMKHKKVIDLIKNNKQIAPGGIVPGQKIGNDDIPTLLIPCDSFVSKKVEGDIKKLLEAHKNKYRERKSEMFDWNSDDGSLSGALVELHIDQTWEECMRLLLPLVRESELIVKDGFCEGCNSWFDLNDELSLLCTKLEQS